MPDPSGRRDTPNGDRFPGLMWFRRDLRLEDNPAWSAATSQHREVTALYVLDDRLLRSTGPFRRRQLVHQMHALDRSLRARGGRLLVRRGDPIAVVPAEASRLGATCVHWNADVSPYATKRDGAVISALRVGASTPFGHLVLPPGAVVTGAGSVSKVFGAFHRKWQATPWDPWPEPGDARIGNDAGQGLPAAEGEPPMMLGEEGARAALEYFIAASLDDYIAGRDRIPERATSEMSLPSGSVLSPRDGWSKRSIRLRTQARLSFANSLGGTGSPTCWRRIPPFHLTPCGQDSIRSSGATIKTTSVRGRKGKPGIRSSTPACESCPEQVRCTTGFA